MTSVNATTAATPTTATSSTGTSTSTTSSTTATKKSFDALFAEAKDDLKKGEKLSKVDGHQFGRIKGGERDDMCLNLSGNARSGKAFDLIWRDGRQFHVYGTGKDRQVVEVGHKAATTPSTTGATTTDGTSSTGTTTTDSTAAAGTDTSSTTAGSTTGGTSTTAK